MHGTDIFASWASNKTIDIRVWDLSTLMVTAGKMIEEAGDRVLGGGRYAGIHFPYGASPSCVPNYPCTRVHLKRCSSGRARLFRHECAAGSSDRSLWSRYIRSMHQVLLSIPFKHTQSNSTGYCKCGDEDSDVLLNLHVRPTTKSSGSALLARRRCANCAGIV